MRILDMDIPDAVALAVIGFFTAVASSASTWLVMRVQKAPDVQASLDKAVAGVVDHYVKALASSHDEMREMRGEIRALRETIVELESHIDDLTEAMKSAGVTPPPRRRRKAESA